MKVIAMEEKFKITDVKFYYLNDDGLPRLDDNCIGIELELEDGHRDSIHIKFKAENVTLFLRDSEKTI